MLRATGHDADATKAYEAALKIAEELQDLRGQAHASQRLGRTFREPRHAATKPWRSRITLHETT